MKTRFSSILKKLLIRIIIVVILFFAKQYINLDYISDLVYKLIIVISTFLLDFKPFTFEITKGFFNEKSGDEGEGSNRQNNNNNNNNTPNQGSSINFPSSGETSEVAENIPDNSHVEATVEELDEEKRRLIEEQTRLIDQYQARVEARSLDQIALNERQADINERIREFNNLKDQSQSDGSPIPGLTDIECQIEKDSKALSEDGKRIRDEILTYNTEIYNYQLDIARLTVRILEKKMNESDSE
jgi:hypothetical protein